MFIFLKCWFGVKQKKPVYLMLTLLVKCNLSCKFQLFAKCNGFNPVELQTNDQISQKLAVPTEF